jgi:exonuclease III
MREIKLYSWNIQTLYRAGASKMLTDEIDRYDVDILAIQEMRWTRGGIIEKKNHTIFYSCKQKEYTLRMGLLVNNRLKHSIIDFNPISSRMCIIRMA